MGRQGKPETAALAVAGRNNLYVATVMLDNTFAHGQANACAIKPAARL